MRIVELKIYKFEDLPEITQKNILLMYSSNYMSFMKTTLVKAEKFLKDKCEYLADGTLFNTINTLEPEVIIAVRRNKKGE